MLRTWFGNLQKCFAVTAKIVSGNVMSANVISANAKHTKVMGVNERSAVKSAKFLNANSINGVVLSMQNRTQRQIMARLTYLLCVCVHESINN